METAVEVLIRWRPILDEIDEFLRFAVYLTKAPFVGETGRTLISEPILRRIFGGPVRYRPGWAPGCEELLTRYRDEVDDEFEWTGWNAAAGFCREVRHDGVPAEIKRLCINEGARVEAPRIYAMTGRQVTRKEESKHRSAMLAAAESCEPANDPPEEARRWARYLNSRSSRTFDALRTNFADAWHAAGEIENMASRRHARAVLDGMRSQPVPIYHYSDNSARIVAPRSLQQLQSDIRPILYPAESWVELDASKAQLAIAAREWGDLPLTTEYLREHLDGEFDLWGDLADYCRAATGEPLNARGLRAMVKRGIYAVVYGGGETTGVPYAMREGYRSSCGRYPVSEAVAAFVDHPMIREILDAREDRFEEIRSNGGMPDCFGRWIGTDGLGDHPERSSLAQAAQAREMWLMMPVLDLAEEEDEKARPSWEIVLYQFDGVTIKIRRKRRGDRERVLRALTDAFDTRVRRAGYLTRLVEA